METLDQGRLEHFQGQDPVLSGQDGEQTQGTIRALDALPLEIDRLDHRLCGRYLRSHQPNDQGVRPEVGKEVPAALDPLRTQGGGRFFLIWPRLGCGCGRFLSGDEKDYFYFEPSAPGKIDLTLTNIGPGHDYDLYLRDRNLHPPIGISDRRGNADERIGPKDLLAGRYFVQLYNYSRIGSSRPYHLRLGCP